MGIVQGLDEVTKNTCQKSKIILFRDTDGIACRCWSTCLGIWTLSKYPQAGTSQRPGSRKTVPVSETRPSRTGASLWKWPHRILLSIHSLPCGFASSHQEVDSCSWTLIWAGSHLALTTRIQQKKSYVIINQLGNLLQVTRNLFKGHMEQPEMIHKKSCHCLGERYGIDLTVKKSGSFYSPSLKTLLQSYKVTQPSIPQVASKWNSKIPVWQPLLTPRCASAPIFNCSGSDKLPNDCSYIIPQGRSTEELPSRSQYKFQVSKQLF